MIFRLLFCPWLLIVVAAISVLACTRPQDREANTISPEALASAQESGSEKLQPARVVRVIDGDTIEVDLNGGLYNVRYIGIDTPETKHPTRGVEPYGLEAAERNRQLVEGKTVYLEKDVSEMDKYDRLLRYVYVDDVMVNAVLVQEGYAQVSTYPPDVKYTEEFLKLQRQAREEGRGLWAGMPVESEGDEEVCDPSYPTVCIPPPPPDLDCSDIPHREFKVLPPDPHRFDGDKDGVGCER